MCCFNLLDVDTNDNNMDEFSQRIILASASPRRREILDLMGIEFEVKPSDADESAISAPRPSALVKKLSALKVRTVSAVIASDATCQATSSATDGTIVIGADTVVVYRNKVYGKPHTCENAEKMLATLCGRWHTVYTGVCVICGKKEFCFAVKSKVKLKAMSADEIKEYVRDTRPLDKAGAYGIQDGLLVEKYKGSYTNIVGLPKEKLASVLAKVGVNNVNG